MSKVIQRYLDIVDKINNATTQVEHALWEAHKSGFQDALEHSGWGEVSIGSLIMAADEMQMDRGIDRPMTGGVFHDWQPASAKAAQSGGAK